MSCAGRKRFDVFLSKPFRDFVKRKEEMSPSRYHLFEYHFCSVKWHDGVDYSAYSATRIVVSVKETLYVKPLRILLLPGVTDNLFMHRKRRQEKAFSFIAVDQLKMIITFED